MVFQIHRDTVIGGLVAASGKFNKRLVLPVRLAIQRRADWPINFS